ncbi:hypothetical protein MBLNU457_7297t1 [Dothideomycetes sp. NU457]
MAPALTLPSPSPTPSPSPPKSSVLHRSLHTSPPHVISAQGKYLHLSNGQKILDATGGAAVSCLGHGNARVKKAVMAQMDQVAYCHSAFYGTSAGSEAMDAAMKLARQYFVETAQPQRTRFIARRQSYHGATLGSLAMGGHAARRAIYEPLLLDNISHVSPCNAYRMREGETEERYLARLIRELEEEFEAVGPQTVCAFVAEPVVGAALGCVPPVRGYFEAVRKVCDRYGALLILDEVMCGIGRTGSLHAWQDPLVGVVPDIQTVGKGLGAGYAPIAAVLVGQRVVDVLEKGTGAFSHGQTYQGHPLSCAAALEVQRVIRDKRLVQNVASLGVYLERLLREQVAPLPYVGNVRGRGFFWGIEFVQDKQTKEPFPLERGVATGVHELGMLEPYNISLYPGNGTMDGKRGDHVLIAPAYNVQREDIELIVATTARVIAAFFAKL